MVPNPFSLKDEMLNGKGENWYSTIQRPSTDYHDLANFIGLTQSYFWKRLQSDDKQGICYRFFTCEFVISANHFYFKAMFSER